MNCRKPQPCADSHFRMRIIPCGHEMASASFLIPLGSYFGELTAAPLKNWRKRRNHQSEEAEEVTFQARCRGTESRCSCALVLMAATFGACLWMETVKQNR